VVDIYIKLFNVSHCFRLKRSLTLRKAGWSSSRESRSWSSTSENRSRSTCRRRCKSSELSVYTFQISIRYDMIC